MYFFRTSAFVLVAAALAAAQDFGNVRDFAGVSTGLLRGNGFGNGYRSGHGSSYGSGYGSSYGSGYGSSYGSGYGSDSGFGGSSGYAVVPVVQSVGGNYAQNDAGSDTQRVNVVRSYGVNDGNGYGNAVRGLRNNAVSSAPAVLLASPAVNTVSYNDLVDSVDRDAFRGYSSAAAAVPVFDNEFSGNRLVTYSSPAVSTFGNNGFNDAAYEVETLPVTTKVVRTTTVVLEGVEGNTDANLFQNSNAQAARASVVPTVIPVATTGYRTSGFGGNRVSNGASRTFVTSSSQSGSLFN